MSVSKVLLAPAGSTGNNTHGSVTVEADAEEIAFLFVCEAIGGGPAVTWKIQGTMQRGADANDAAAQWHDIPYVTEAAATEAVTARTGPIIAGTAQVEWLAMANVRFFQRFRAVVSGNTNVTYRVEMYGRDSE